MNLASTRSTAGMSASTKFSSTPSCAAAAGLPGGTLAAGVSLVFARTRPAPTAARRACRGPRRATPARCAGLRRRGHGRRRRPGLRGGRQRHGQRRQAIQPRLRRVGATAAVRRRATGKRGQYGHAHDLAPGRRAGGLRQAILRHCVTSRSGWRGQLDRCAVLIQKRHSGWRHGALTRYFQHRDGRPGPGGGRIDAAQVDPVRPQRQTPRLRQQPAQQGSARASSRLRRQRPSGPGAVTSAASRPAPGRGAATLPSPGRARFAREARWPAMFPARCSPRRRVVRARALGPGQRRLDQRQPAQRGQRQQGAAGQHAALARRQSEPIIPGARAPVRDALAPLPRTAPPPGAGTRSSRAARGCRACGGARRRRQPPAWGSTDTPSLAAALIQSGVPLPAPGHGARRAPSPHPTRRPHSASRPLRRWRRPDAAWPRPTGTRTPIARDRLATAGGPGARDRSRGPGRGTPVAHGHARARAVRRRRVQAARPATAGRRSTPWRRWRPI